MKIFNTIGLSLLAALLVACGGTADTEPTATEEPVEMPQETVTEPSEPEPSDDGPLQEVGDTLSFEGGTMELLKVATIDETFTTGPIEMTVTKISVMNFQPNDLTKPAFDDKDNVTIIGVGMAVENTSADTINFYPDQSNLVTNTKEQVTPNLLISEQTGGEFFGEVVKEGVVGYVVESAPSDIEAITVNVMAPSDEAFSTVGEPLTLDFTF